MASIDVNAFTQQMKKRLSEMSANKLKATVLKLVDGPLGLRNIAERWRKEIRELLSKPAALRGYTKGKINPHDSLAFNNGFPMMMRSAGLLGEQLRDTISASVNYRIYNDNATITVKANYKPIMNKQGSYDYGQVLEDKHPILKGYRERLEVKLQDSINNVLRTRGYV